MNSSFYSKICSQIILPLSDIAGGRKISKYNRFLNNAQWWPTSKLFEYQLSKLKSTLEFARAHSPYYNNLFKEKNLIPEKIDSLSHLSEYPLLTKKIIHNQLDLIIPPLLRKGLIIEKTSGSTGEQTTIYLSRLAQSFTYAAELQMFGWSGYALGDSVVQTGMTLIRGFEKKIKDRIFNCHYVPAFFLKNQDIEKIGETFSRSRPQFLIGYASSLYAIASYFNKTRRRHHLKGIISLGDTLFDHYRKELEIAFSCPVTDTYGSCEGFMIAGQCQHQNYHVPMPLNIVEIIDSQGNPVEPGTPGKIVLTRLDKNPMPLIRYEIGDLGILSSQTSCACGRGYQMIEKIIGRDTDIVISPNGHRLIVHFFTAIMEHEDSIEQFQVRQEILPKIKILIVTRKNFTGEVLERIEKKILEKCDYDLKIDFQICSEIKATKSGKRRFVISKLEFN